MGVESPTAGNLDMTVNRLEYELHSMCKMYHARLIKTHSSYTHVCLVPHLMCRPEKVPNVNHRIPHLKHMFGLFFPKKKT